MKRHINTLLIIIGLLFTSQLLFAQVPTVTLRDYIARGATKAFARISTTSNGASIRQVGVCWSTDSKEPTINDNKSVSTFSNNGTIYRMNDLTPAKEYYVRGYATTTAGDTYYSNVVRFYTLPKGTVTWGYDNGGSEAQNNRINNALASMVEYWNDLTNITGLYLSVHFGAQTPTADCSYGGWMRIGPNEGNQKTGTVMHEALHAIGVGQHDVWYGATTPLRSGSGTGTWLGDRATELIRFWDNNNAATVSGDKTHVWPYGINGAHEDNGTEMLYTITSLLAQALGEDGLPCTTARPCGSPHWSFQHEEGVKYYIKNESLNTSSQYLYETGTHTLRFLTKTAELAKADDAYAWYISFNPATQCYTFKNAKSGYYISYSGSSFMTSPAASEIQLNKSRCDVVTADGNQLTGIRGYWMISRTGNVAYKGVSSNTNSEALNLSNDAKVQRWIILSADETQTFEDTYMSKMRNGFYDLKKNIEALLATPHTEITEGTDAKLLAAIETNEKTVATATKESAVTTAKNNVIAAMRTFLRNTYVNSLDRPYDLTFFINNPGFDNGMDGWQMSTGAACNYSEVEYYQKSINVSQDLLLLPMGTYEVKMQGFQRPGSYTDVYNSYKAGTNNVDATLSLKYKTTSSSVKINNIMDDRSAKSLNSADKQMADGTYIADNMAGAQQYFLAGKYDNGVTYYLSEVGTMTISLTSTGNTGTSYWTIFDNFRLYYYGGLTMDAIKEKLSAGIPGDADGNGVVDINDAKMVIDYYLGKNPQGINMKNADVNGDGKVTVDDANIIINTK
ncbi:MAG: dockerin type I repeat-containing protein [Prevotella sp.]|nr:dockerin type I repeat-containing protein [Candidatus Prevotella equi]